MKARYLVAAVGAVAAVSFGVFMAYASRESYGYPVLESDLGPPMSLERAEAARLGMRPIRRGVAPARDRRWKMDFALRADECVSLVVGVTGIATIDRLDLVDRARVGLASIPAGGQSHVAQVQWCAHAATNVTAKLELVNELDVEVPQVRWELASGRRGPDLDERRLTRNDRILVATREALDRADEAAAVARIVARARQAETDLVPDASNRSEPLGVDARSAVLLPPERTTLLALQRALMTRDARPAVAPYFAPAPEWLAPATPLPEIEGTESAALLRVAGGFERVLAAADLSALGPGCVALTFARIEEPVQASPVVRVTIPSLARTELAERDGVWSDRVCPADGIFLYTIPAAAAAPYEVRVHALPGAPRARARPRRLAWDGQLLASEERTQLDADCRAPQRAACLSLALALDRDGASATEVDRALSHACDEGSAEACGRLSERWLAGLAFERHERAIEVERIACDRGDMTSCARRATRLRSAPDPTADLPEARRLYGRACSEGNLAAACANLREMESLQLGVR